MVNDRQLIRPPACLSVRSSCRIIMWALSLRWRGKRCSVSINHVSRTSEIWPVQVCQPPAMRAALVGNQSNYSCVSVWTWRTPLHVCLDVTGSSYEETKDVRFTLNLSIHFSHLYEGHIKRAVHLRTKIFIIYSTSCFSKHIRLIFSHHFLPFFFTVFYQQKIYGKNNQNTKVFWKVFLWNTEIL